MYILNTSTFLLAFLLCSHCSIRAAATEAIMIMSGGFRKFVGAEMEERPT